jgi:hypothetical protein
MLSIQGGWNHEYWYLAVGYNEVTKYPQSCEAETGVRASKRRSGVRLAHEAVTAECASNRRRYAVDNLVYASLLE